MAEIRLDRCALTARETEELFTSDIPLVATCRISELAANEPSLQKPELTPLSREIKAMQMAEKRLIRAIEAGARYVDVEIEAQKQMSKRVRQAAHENGTVFIRSYHDFEGTSSFEALKAVVEKCVYHGADMVKIVTTAHSEADVEKVLALYEWCREEKKSGNERIGALADGGLLAFCMGEAGRQSRVDCLKMGAPYTYAALSEEEAAAPGQWAVEDMKKEIYGDFPFIGYRTCCENTSKVCQVPPNLGGPATVSYEKCGRSIMPVSKSFAQRAIIAAALADGTSHLRGYTPCGDNEAAIQVAKNLGAEVCRDGNMLTIKGISAQLGSLDKLQSSSGTPSLDENGNPVYTYSKQWNFDSDRVIVNTGGNYTATDPVLTLYAVWVPLFEVQFYDRANPDQPLKVKEFNPNEGLNLTVPRWDENTGVMAMGEYPSVSGKTFNKVYYDAAGSQPVTGDSAVHPGKVNNATGQAENAVLKLYIDYP